MSENDTMGALAGALAKAQAAFLPVEKTRTVTVKMRAEKGGGSYQFSYAPLDTVLAATRPALGANGLALTQLIVHDELITLLIHEGGGSLEARSILPKIADMQGLGGAITYLRRYAIQAILGVAAEDDDDGNAAVGNARDITDEERHEAEFLAAKAAKAKAVPPAPPAGKPAATAPERAAAAGKPVAAAATVAREDAALPGHVKRFFAVAGELGIVEDDQKKILGEFKIASRRDITSAQLPAILRRMEEWVGAAPPEPVPDEAPAPDAVKGTRMAPVGTPVAARSPLVSVFDVKRIVERLDKCGATPHGPCASMFVGRKISDVREITRDELPGLLKFFDAIAAKDEGALKLLAAAKSQSVPF